MIILFGKETRLPVDAGLDEVLGNIGKLNSWAAWHIGVGVLQVGKSIDADPSRAAADKIANSGTLAIIFFSQKFPVFSNWSTAKNCCDTSVRFVLVPWR